MNTVDHVPAGTKTPDAAVPYAAQFTECPGIITCTRSFPGLPESVSAARSWAAGFFPCPAASADVALMISELVTNAIQYSASRLLGGQVTVTVTVSTGEGLVRVDVIDEGTLPPHLAAPGGLGQGLTLVAGLADTFGADGCDRWFAVRTGGAR